MKIYVTVIGLVLLAATATMSHAKTDLPLPRFVSVRSEEANLRTGPGLRYPIRWIMKRKGIPVEVIAEFEQWRKVRDIQGDEGWVHRSQLSNIRSAVIIGEPQVLREGAELNSEPVAKLEVGVQGELLECRVEGCMLSVDSFKGWVSREFLWGVYPNETFE